MKKKNLVIFGTGLFSELAFQYFQELSEYDVVAFSCDPGFSRGENFLGRPLVGANSLTDLYPPESHSLFIAVGYRNMNKIRESLYARFKLEGYTFASFVFPDVRLWNNNSVGENVFIFENNTIQPHVIIGDNTILWSGNHIGHHSSVGKHCFLSSHVVISGSCILGDNVFIGVNATLYDGVRVGNRAMIGGGCLITTNVSADSVYLCSGNKPHPRASDRLRV